MKHLFLLIVALMTCTTHAQSIQDLIKGAEKGEPEALGKLGLCYFIGQNGVEQDYTKAFSNLTESAQKGFNPSKLVLGDCYENGKGTSRDKRKAIQLYQEAYDGGILMAAKYLGRLYLNDQDYQKAKIWLEKCQTLNDGYVNWALGNIYYFGLGTNIDYNKAYVSFTKSSTLGYRDAYYSLGLCYSEGNGVNKDDEMAVSLWKKGSELGDKFSLRKLGICYSEGVGVGKDIHLAINYWERAYSLGDMESGYNLGITYFDEKNGVKNIDTAIKYWNAGAIKGHIKSARKLGLQYLIGKECSFSIARAYKYLSISADKGDADSQYFVGAFLIRGDSIPQDTILGLQYMKLAADQSHKKALEYYSDWNYTISNIDTAILYWEKGVKINSTHCMNNLGVCYIEGKGKNVDFKKGFSLFEEAYHIEPNPLSLLNLAECYYNGSGVDQNYEMTYKLLMKSIDFEDAPSSAYFLLSKCYRFGRGVPKNLKEADRLLDIASQKGNNSAIAISSLITSLVE